MSDSSDSEEVPNYEENLYSSDDENEVLVSENDDDDDDDDDDEVEEKSFGNVNRFSRFKIEMKKDEMASDLEDEESYLPNSQAWGSNKQMFYHTDYIDKDFRSQKQKDEELAQYEEAEALEIQKRLLESVSENDLGIELLIGSTDKQPKVDLKEAVESESANETLCLEMASMKESQKRALIRKESPELDMVMGDFKKYMDELQHELEPLLHGLQARDAKHSLGLKYLKIRYVTLMNYCTHISFYLALKSSQDKQIVKDHPIIKQLLMHKKIISQLDLCQTNNSKFLNEISFAIKMINNNRLIEFTDVIEVDPMAQETKSKLPIDEMSVKDEVDEDDNEAVIDADAKRAITVEMEKNKGLTPKRKREQRNPRVKYRKKFEKAVIRRKGQVRQPRKELHKYGGELTGINVRAVKSVKLK